MSKQLLRSGIALGALVREAEQGESRPDFIHKLAIVLKESSESEYWLELLLESEHIDEKGHTFINTDLKALLKLLTSITKTAKGS